MQQENSYSSRPNKKYTVQVPKKQAGGKGHDLILRALQESGREIEVFMSSGDVVRGKVVGRDKFTITVLVESDAGVTKRHVIYKHAIDQFIGQESSAQAQ